MEGERQLPRGPPWRPVSVQDSLWTCPLRVTRALPRPRPREWRQGHWGQAGLQCRDGEHSAQTPGAVTLVSPSQAAGHSVCPVHGSVFPDPRLVPAAPSAGCWASAPQTCCPCVPTAAPRPWEGPCTCWSGSPVRGCLSRTRRRRPMGLGERALKGQGHPERVSAENRAGPRAPPAGPPATGPRAPAERTRLLAQRLGLGRGGSSRRRVSARAVAPAPGPRGGRAPGPGGIAHAAASTRKEPCARGCCDRRRGLAFAPEGDAPPPGFVGGELPRVTA